MEWLISANSNIYDHESSFNDYGYIDWVQKYKFNVGDAIFIYSTRPKSKILYLATVERVNMIFSQIRDDQQYWKNTDYYNRGKTGEYCRLVMVKRLDKMNLSLNILLKNGLNAAPQGAQKITGQLKEYIHSVVFAKQTIDASNEYSEYVEGAIKQAVVNRYERNYEARKKCLDYHGYDCYICGFNFLKTYGDIGKDFIHVHHVVPISSRGIEYQINPIKDLIPVCPNCHAMLHKKEESNWDTVIKIKKVLTNKHHKKKETFE